jgi:UDP-galactopyranose mutase
MNELVYFKNNYDYVIVGAGLTGSILAYELTKLGKNVAVVEKRDHVGGNLYTKNKLGINIHRYGPHVFHTTEKWVWDYVNQFATFKPYVQRTYANYHNKLYSLPFNMNTYHEVFEDNSAACLDKLAAEIKKYQKKKPRNLEEQALSLVGPSIYNILVKGYTEKQWGKPCKKLSPELIKRLPLRYDYNNNYFNDKYQGMPQGGYTQIFEKLLKGVDVFLEFDYDIRKDEIKGKQVIHTGMIDKYFNYKYGDLEYRSLRFEETCWPCSQFQKYPVVNYTDRDIPYTRIIEHKHFESAGTRYTFFTKEYPVKYVRGMEAYYPINNKKTEKKYQKYLKLAEKEGIIFCGRLGAYRYLDMDDAIIAAFELLNKLKEVN